MTKIENSQNEIKPILSKMRWKNILLGLATGIITLAVLIWTNFPVLDLIDNQISQAYTPTPHPPTMTLVPSKIPTHTASPTIEPTPTITSLPSSAYLLSNDDMPLVEPPVPEMAKYAVLLNDDVNVTVSPDFSDLQWTHSSAIGEQIGIEFTEQFYATFSPGIATWRMDVPLDPGLYEVYVLDTLFSSGGRLEFHAFLGDNEIKPILGNQFVDYKSSRGNPPQRTDLWQSIGIYDIRDTNTQLSVSTQWDLRDEQTIVAIDRMLIAHLPETLHQIINLLPSDRTSYIVDDSFAEFETLQYWETKENSLSWGDNYQMMVNPPIVTYVTWRTASSVPVGVYEIFAWIPSIHGTSEVKYRVLANDSNELQSHTGDFVFTITQGDEQEPHWVSLGTWTVPEVYGDTVALSLQIETTNDSIGEVAIDAVAFVR